MKTNTIKTKYCISCKHGEIEREADYKVQGTIYNDYLDKNMPYKAYLCKDHLEMMLQDGAELEVIEHVSEEAKDELTKEVTGYHTFNELCRNYPTLRPINKKLKELRKHYREATGKEAFK